MRAVCSSRHQVGYLAAVGHQHHAAVNCQGESVTTLSTLTRVASHLHAHGLSLLLAGCFSSCSVPKQALTGVFWVISNYASLFNYSQITGVESRKQKKVLSASLRKPESQGDTPTFLACSISSVSLSGTMTQHPTSGYIGTTRPGE